MGPVEVAAGCLSAIAHALGFLFYQQAEPRRQLLDYLRDKRLLLVLDRFEHLLLRPSPQFPPSGGEHEGGEIDLMTQILQAAPGCQGAGHLPRQAQRGL